MATKNARLDIKTTQAAKATLEQAAYILGTTLSGFILESAMTKANEILMSENIIRLNRKESERFILALQKPIKANTKLKQLFIKHQAE